MKTITVTCVNTNKSYKIPLGTTLQELKGIVYPRGTEKILGALVNNQLQDLQYIVITPVQVKFIDYATTEGYQIYCRSLIFVLYNAISELYPNYKLRVEYPIANGLYCSIINGGKSVDEETILRLKMKMREIVDENLPIKREEVETSKVCNLFRKQGLKDKADLLENRGKFNTSLYYLNRTFDYFYGALAPSTGYLSNFDLIHYKTGMLLILPDRRNIDQLLPYLPQEKLFQTFNEHRQWGKVISVTDIHHLNHIVKNNFFFALLQF